MIIPTYNRARYVTKAVDSVLNQKIADLEVIVVDDGSRDETAEVLERYRGRIRYLYQENSGVSAARNAGIRQSRGSWVAFLDSDDEWMSGYLEFQWRSVERFPGAVAHLTNSTATEYGRPTTHHAAIGLLPKFRDEDQIFLSRPFRTIVSHQHWFLQATIIRRDVLLQAGLFNPGLSIAEDMDLLARVALRGAFTIARAVLVRICRREEELASLSSQYMSRGIYSRKSFGRVFNDLRKSPELNLVEKIAVSKALSERWRALANLYLVSGDPVRAREYYSQAMLAYPGLSPLLKYLGSFLPQAAAVLLVRKTDIVPGDEGDMG